MSLPLAAMLKSAVLFVAAGLCEIGGGYLVWQWLRNGRGLAMGAVGGVVLFLYGVIPTFQPQHFSRVYAAYGGVFVALSLAWGWILDGQIWLARGVASIGVAGGGEGRSHGIEGWGSRPLVPWGPATALCCLGRQKRKTMGHHYVPRDT